ncbi:hypothetical protein ACIQNI_29065 [Streptomyces sp. NPDC091266]|uniref:hypothetical protein n=1 Tax=Streptomyces sp. NPDC091266 TaxID=3365978 RepID=UPI003807CA05
MNISSRGTVWDACTALFSPTLIRLISEIDDNGPIPARRLTGTFADLSVRQLRQTADLACDFGLVRVRPGTGLGLTNSGLELADVYDAMARWARRHAYPEPVCHFTSRIQSTLDLLTEASVLAAEGGPCAPAADPALRAEALADLARPRDLLDQWLRSNQTAQRDAAEPAP